MPSSQKKGAIASVYIDNVGDGSVMKQNCVILERFAQRHLEEVVALHLQVFPGDFITMLGKRFLLEIFYPLFLVKPGMGFVAMDEGKVVGYVVGGRGSGGLAAGKVLRVLPGTLWGLAIRALGAPRRFWGIGIRVLRELGIKYPTGQGVLAYIAVAPSWQGKGIGRRLVENFVEALKEEGVKECYVKGWAGNKAGEGLYLSCGFRVWRQFNTPEGLRRIYRLEL